MFPSCKIVQYPLLAAALCSLLPSMLLFEKNLESFHFPASLDHGIPTLVQLLLHLLNTGAKCHQIDTQLLEMAVPSAQLIGRDLAQSPHGRFLLAPSFDAIPKPYRFITAIASRSQQKNRCLASCRRRQRDAVLSVRLLLKGNPKSNKKNTAGLSMRSKKRLVISGRRSRKTGLQYSNP